MKLSNIAKQQNKNYIIYIFECKCGKEIIMPNPSFSKAKKYKCDTFPKLKNEQLLTLLQVHYLITKQNDKYRPTLLEVKDKLQIQGIKND